MWQARLRVGLTQREMARRMTKSRASVINWESNRRRPFPDALASWARITGTTVAELLGEQAVLEDDEQWDVPHPRGWHVPVIRGDLARYASLMVA